MRVWIDAQARELTVKLVYYGAALSGKTTNLQAIHRLADGETRGRLMTLETRDDRTLFFDLLPLQLRACDTRVRFKLFTVPGQVIHAATRKLVLTQADGIAFIADSRVCETDANADAFNDMLASMNELGMDPMQTPIVLQFNKRDLADIRSDEELDALGSQGREPIFKAMANSGAGVIETLLGLVDLTWKRLEHEHRLEHSFGVTRPEVLEALATRLRPPEGTSSAPRPAR